jgi:hypothetical protein
MDPIAGFIAPGTTCDSLASEARMADRFSGAGYGSHAEQTARVMVALSSAPP